MTRSLSHLLSRSFSFATQQYLGPLLILLGALSACLIEPQLGENLVYNRLFVSQGEWWRLISAHFFHTNQHHFSLNIAALGLLWALQGHLYTVKSYLLVFFCSAMFAGMGVHLFSPELSQYVGLSGALHGIFIWGALQAILTKEKLGYILLLGIALKLFMEQRYGTAEDLAVMIDAIVAIDAHLWGAIGGGVMFLVLLCVNNAIKTRVNHSEPK